jgi:large subunit ribosomal protein L35
VARSSAPTAFTRPTTRPAAKHGRDFRCPAGCRPVVFCDIVCHNPALPRPGSQGLPWLRRSAQSAHFIDAITGGPGRLGSKFVRPEQESQMPKIKTKSGAKKRFKITATGKVLYQQSRKRHGMIKRTKKQIRQLRGTNVLFKTDGDNIKKYFLPNG